MSSTHNRTGDESGKLCRNLGSAKNGETKNMSKGSSCNKGLPFKINNIMNYNNPEDRKKLYKMAYEYMLQFPAIVDKGMCDMISFIYSNERSTWSPRLYAVDVPSKFPELEKFRPFWFKRLNAPSGYWFPLNEKGREKRLKILKKLSA